MTDRQSLIEAVSTPAFVPISELMAAGFHTRTILRAVEEGEIVKLAPGLYCSLELASRQYIDYVAMHRQTGGVVFGLTAASIHGLSDAIPPKKAQLIVPNEYNRKTGFPIHTYRTRRPEMLTAGVVDFEVMPGWTFKVTNEARTIVDLYRNPGLVQHAQDGLADYVERKLSMIELLDLAKTFDVHERIKAQLDMIEFFRGRGIVPK